MTKYSNDDRKNIGELYMEVHSNKQKEIVKEENFYDVEDDAERMDGDLDYSHDNEKDSMEEKVYSKMNEKFGKDFNEKCKEIKEKFDLNEDEFFKYFKNWFTENYNSSYIKDGI